MIVKYLTAVAYFQNLPFYLNTCTFMQLLYEEDNIVCDSFKKLRLIKVLTKTRSPPAYFRYLDSAFTFGYNNMLQFWYDRTQFI